MGPSAGIQVRAQEGGLVGIEGAERSGGSQRGEAGAVVVVHVGSTARVPKRISRRARVA